MADVGNMKVVIEGENKLDKDLKKSEKSMLSFKNVAEVALGVGIADALKTAAQAVAKFVKEGVQFAADYQSVMIAFENMTGNMSENLVRRMDEAAAGTVSALDMIKNANQAMLLGIDKEALPKMMEISRAAAKATGQDMTYMFQSIATGMGRQSKLILDNLGIIVDASKAYDIYAKSIDKTASALTEEEKKQAFVNATLLAGEEVIKKAGDATETFNEKKARLGATIKDLQTGIGKEFIPTLESLADVLNDVLSPLADFMMSDAESIHDMVTIKSSDLKGWKDFAGYLSEIDKLEIELLIDPKELKDIREQQNLLNGETKYYVDNLMEAEIAAQAQTEAMEELFYTGKDMLEVARNIADAEIRLAEITALLTDEVYMNSVTEATRLGLIEEYGKVSEKVRESMKAYGTDVRALTSELLKQTDAQNALTAAQGQPIPTIKGKTTFNLNEASQRIQDLYNATVLTGPEWRQYKDIFTTTAATGGFVGKTGMALIHKGETIIPADRSPGNQIAITVNADVSSELDIYRLSQMLGDNINEELSRYG